MTKNRIAISLIASAGLLAAYGLGLLTYRNDLPPLSYYRKLKQPPLNLFTDTSLKTKVDCPAPGARTMVILALGQSNAANRSNSREAPYASMPEVVNFYNGACYRINGPLLGATTNENSVPDGNPVWPMVGEQLLNDKKADYVVIALFAVGGTAIRKWVDEQEFVTILGERLKSLNQAGLPPTHIAWFQGENDNEERTKGTDYTASFLRLVTLIREHQVTAPIFPSQTTMCAEHPKNPDLRLAQQQLANEKLGIFPGPDTDQFGFAYRFDGCHFSFEGRQALAKAWAESLSAIRPRQ